MNLNHLYYFQTLAKLRTFSEAAEQLYITQPSLSMAIQALERELGKELFVRSRNLVSLTDEGKVFLKYVQNSLETLELGKLAVNDYESPASGDIRFIVDRFNIAEFIRKFRASANCSLITTSLSQTVFTDVESAFLNGSYDFAFNSIAPASKDVEGIAIPDNYLVLCVPLDHRYAKLKSIDLRDVDWNQRVIIHYDSKTPTVRRVYSALEQVGYDLHRASCIVRSTFHLADLVESGFGIGITINFEKLNYFSLSAIPITFPETHGFTYFYRKKDKPLSSASAAFWKFICTHFTNYRSGTEATFGQGSE